jgi:hypothetical protein
VPGFSGASIESLDQLAHALGQAAERMGRLVGEVERSLDVQWQGPDAERFRSWWRDQHRGAVISAREALDAAATSVSRNRDEQVQASGVVVGSPTIGLGAVSAAGVAGFAIGANGALQGNRSQLQGSQHNAAATASALAPEASLAVTGTYGASSGALPPSVTAKDAYGDGSYGVGGVNAATCVRWAIVRRHELGQPIAYTGSWDRSPKEPGLGAVIGYEDVANGGFGRGVNSHAMVIEAIDRSDPNHIRLQVSESNFARGHAADVRVRELDISRNPDGVTFSGEGHQFFISQ